MSRNMRTWKNEASAKNTLRAGIGFDLIVIIAGVIFRNVVSPGAAALAGVIVMWHWYRTSMSKRYEMSIGNGAERGAWPTTLAIGLLGLVIHVVGLLLMGAAYFWLADWPMNIYVG